MEKLAFTRVNLFNVKVITTIILVLLEKSLSQVVMGLIPVLECRYVRCTWALMAMSYHVWH
jgi:hypothetical protein